MVPPAVEELMPAQSVDGTDTQPRITTPECDNLLKIITPLCWQAWEEELRNAGVLDQYQDIIHNLQFSFPSGVTSTPLETFTPRNHTSSLSAPDAILEYINKEVAVGRYTGPFSKDTLESVIGPFRTSPLGAVPKPNSDKIRLVQDLSYPRNDPLHCSVNSEIDSSDFPCKWGSFTDAYLFVARAPPGTQASVFDVEAAFRRIPMRPKDQVHGVVMWMDKFFVDHCFCFGGSSTPGIFGRIADAIVHIFKNHGIEDILKWVDDFIFFRYGKPHSDGSFQYSYSVELIWEIGAKLGWPWAADKHAPFASTFLYIGFSWDLEKKTIQVPEKKKTKYLGKLAEWIEGYAPTLEEVESLAGTLQHVCLAVPEGRSRLPSFWRFKKSFGRSTCPRFVKIKLPAYLLKDIEWWQGYLSNPFCGSKVIAPATPSELSVYVDASTSWGIGIIVNGSWFAWELIGDWRALSQSDVEDRRSIGWAEMVAVELATLYLIAAGWGGHHLIINSDNMGVVGALLGGRSRNAEQNAALCRIVESMLSSSMWITPVYVNTLANPADGPSRGVFDRMSHMLPNIVKIPLPLQPFLRPVSISIP
jgi:hypothetical protein